jgi:2'-5' RNA ligase
VTAPREIEVRVFFALWPDDWARTCIAAAAAAVPASAGASFVPPENYHVTLAFVGEIAMPGLAVLQQIGRTGRAAAVTIEINAYEYWQEAKVLVAVARESRALTELSAQLQGALLPAHRAALPARPHVTLARKVAQAPVLQAMSPFSWRAWSFSLVSSNTSGAHSVYTVVDSWPLLDETPKPQKSL